MRFRYTITELPNDVGGYNVTAFTEGRLLIEHASDTFLDVEGILLVEFAIVIYKWILRARVSEVEPPNLYYASMDFEEEPIFALSYVSGADAFALESVWAQAVVPNVSRAEAISSAEEYLGLLSHELFRKLGVELDEILEAAAADDLPDR